jgi:hypothetical protein
MLFGTFETSMVQEGGMGAKRFVAATSVAISCIGALFVSDPSRAAEYGHGAYLLGFGGPGAGIAPPPGVYFTNFMWFYNGSAGGNISLPFGQQVAAGVNANAQVDLPVLTWSTPVQILGGNLGFSALVPIGRTAVGATATTVPPLPPVSASRRETVFTFGDPALVASIGWHSGNFHWVAMVTGFFPLGDYDKSSLANIALHRLAGDVSGALTWLDPTLGLNLTVVAGVTFNAENTATDYKTGNEFHLEWSATKNLTQQFSLGLVGYYYRQFTADSGAGATLGPFKGEVTALGGTLGYNFIVGQTPVATNVRVYREFNVTNRLQGTSGFFTLAIPLQVSQTPPRPTGMMVTK